MDASSTVLADLSHLLAFLDAKEVAQLITSNKHVVADHVVVWNYIATRMKRFYSSFPLHPPSANCVEPVVLLILLRRLHAMDTFDFAVRFDPERRAPGVKMVEDSDNLVTNWYPQGGSIYGDRACTRDAVSYWELTGLCEGSYVGIVQETMSTAARFQYGAASYRHARLLALGTPACDQLPAIMYCESGFITNGTFRGPKPPLPTKVKFLQAEPFDENDRIGICVDLLEGQLLFLRNGRKTGMWIPIDRQQTYFPIVSARSCYHLRLLPDVRPPWEQIYDQLEPERLLIEKQAEDHEMELDDDHLDSVVP